MKQISVPIIKLPTIYDFELPGYDHDLSSCVNIQAAVSGSVRLAPGERALIPTGFCLALPLGVEAQIKTHQGSALDYGLIVCDAPASIDAAYRSEVKCLIYNSSSEIVIVRRGMYIATMTFAPVLRVAWQEVRPNE